MKKCFKREAESDLGAGIVYLEVQGEWPVRQVEVYGEQWRISDSERSEWLADQPLSELGLEAVHEIMQEEFEAVWKEGLRRWPPTS